MSYATEIALIQAGRYDEAIAVLKLRAKYHHHDPDLHCNLGIAYASAGRAAEAEQVYRMVLEWKPGHPETVSNLADLLARTHRLGDARQLITSLAEHNLHARRVLAMVKIEQLEIEDALLDLLYIAEQTQRSAAYSEWLAYSLHTGYNRAAHELWLKNFIKWKPPARGTWDGKRNIRIGYIGDAFRQCAVAAMLEPVLANHTFDVYLYGGRVRDEAGRRMVAYPCVKEHTDVSAMPYGQVIEHMKKVGLDVLIDLAGHNKGRMDVVARFPAPLQYTYIGYAGDTLIGRNIDQEVGWAYRPPEVLPEVVFPRPAERNGYTTFGSVNRAAKITKKTMMLWGEILANNPTAKMKVMVAGGIKNDMARNRLRWFMGRRVELVGRREKEIDYLAFANEIDFHLDTIPYGGGATTADMLAMNVPTFVMRGPYQMGAWIMGNCEERAGGSSVYVTGNEKDYVSEATFRAENGPLVHDLRGHLLTNGAEVAGRLEALVRRELKVAEKCCG